jgi:hypothetical protein
MSIYEDCVVLSLETGTLHLPNRLCEFRRIQRHYRDSTILEVWYSQAPGICNDKPTETDYRLPEGIEVIKYNIRRRGGGRVLLPLPSGVTTNVGKVSIDDRF